jgi:predicted nucleic-acid-binding protein
VIALDTNVLVRFLVEDDAAQTARAAALIEGVVQAGERLFVSDIVVCELVWVLDAAYRVRRSEIGSTLAALLRAKQLRFESTDRLTRAMHAFNAGRGDFSDYVIREHARGAECDTVATFDRALLKEPGFIAP